MDEWRIEEAENEFRFRRFNEWIKASNERMGSDGPMHEYVCECSDGLCRNPIELSDEEYEEIRGYANRFAIAPDHENPELDHVLAQQPRFSTIEKLPGEAARLAVASDPRRYAAGEVSP